MKFTNSYKFASNLNLSGNVIGKALELLKGKLFNNKEEEGSISGNSMMNCNLSGEMSVELSTEELIELYKEYGDDFERQVKFLKEELRPCVKEFMGAIDDSAKSFQKTLHECEDLERIHDEKVKAERERAAAEEKSE